MTRQAPRFLLVRLGSLGDVIHAVPAAAALRRRYPSARIDWMVDPQYLDVVRLVTVVDRAIPIDTRGPWARTVAALRSAWSTRYDIAIDLQGLIKSAALARLSLSTRVVGLAPSDLREPWARIFYSATASSAVTRHVIHKNLALLRMVDVADAAVTFPLTIPQTDVVERVQAQYGASGYVIVNPGAAWPNKRWPPSRFGQLAARIRERWHVPSVVVWGPGEETLARDVADTSGGAAVLAPPTSVTDLFGLAKRARAMVSGDTGPLHIAAAVGTPIVSLFGPTDPARNGPWSISDVCVSRYDRCSCRYERRCRLERPCIEDIGLEEVVSAFERRLTTSATAAPGGHARRDA